MKRKLSIFASALSADVREAAAQARRLDLSGLLFDAYSFSLNLNELSETGRREFRHVVRSQNVEIVGLRMDAGLKGFAPGADVDRIISRVSRAMEAAAGLLAPLVCVDLGPLPAPKVHAPSPKPRVTPEQAGLLILPDHMMKPADDSPPPAPRSDKDNAFADQLAAALVELGQMADRLSVRLAFSSTLAGFAALDEAIAAARCPWFGVDLDVPALLKDDWSPDDIFSRMGHLIAHVRVRDAMKGADRRTKATLVGRGETNWPELLVRLDDAAFNGWLSLDTMELADRTHAAVVARNVFTAD